MLSNFAARVLCARPQPCSLRRGAYTARAPMPCPDINDWVAGFNWE